MKRAEEWLPSDLRRRLKKRRWGFERQLWSQKNIWAVDGHGGEAEDEYESMIENKVGAHGTNHDADGVQGSKEDGSDGF